MGIFQPAMLVYQRVACFIFQFGGNMTLPEPREHERVTRGPFDWTGWVGGFERLRVFRLELSKWKSKTTLPAGNKYCRFFSLVKACGFERVDDAIMNLEDLFLRKLSWSFVGRWNWFLSLQNETVQNEIVPYSTLPKFNMEPENDDFQVCNLPFQCDTKMEDKI